jgi:uncharacterized membrane protein
MHRATKRRVRLFLWFLLAGTLIGVAYGGLLGFMFRATGLVGALIGAIEARQASSKHELLLSVDHVHRRSPAPCLL